MPHWLRRKILLPVLFIGAAVLMVQCSTHSTPTRRGNGMTCQAHRTSSDGGLSVTTETDCSFRCPNGQLLSLPESVSSQSQDELNFLFCGVPLPANNAGEDGPANGATATAAPPLLPASAVPLLNQQVDICDAVRGIINFVLKQPPMDLTGKKLVVDIAGKQTPCGLDPSFPGELSCKLPPHTAFPTGIVVRVDDQVANIFAYGGADCMLKGGVRSGEALTQPAPTQQVPTSVPPTGQPPTQQPPTHEPPTQQPPTQQPPTSPPPTQQPPTQEPPTQVPSTEAPPATQPPATSQPAPTAGA